MAKVMVVFGTRPEAIKMAPLCVALKKCVEIETIICVTAQHREMLDQVMSIFELSADIDLDIMKKGQDLNDITSSILLKMRDVLEQYRPDIVCVHGDTTTTMAAALAAFYAAVPVAHIEAGLRTFNIKSPFPEEYNRRVTSISAQYHFAPTELSKANLVAENVSPDCVWVTGNTVIDSLFMVLHKIQGCESLQRSIAASLSSVLNFNWLDSRYVLITGHRRENFGQGFLDICSAIETLARRYPKLHFVYPVHLNPNVQGPVNELLSGIDNVHLIQPLDYEVFTYLLSKCYLVLTDSGGIQEEAPSLGKPVLVMRDTSERPEAIEAGTARLVGTSVISIVENVSVLIDDPISYEAMSNSYNPYGDGKSCVRIVEALKGKLNV